MVPIYPLNTTDGRPPKSYWKRVREEEEGIETAMYVWTTNTFHTSILAVGLTVVRGGRGCEIVHAAPLVSTHHMPDPTASINWETKMRYPFLELGM